MEKIEKRQSNFISFAGVFSALAVVYLHANGCFWDFSATERYWFTANIIESVCYFAVPVFFMISGATLMDFFDRYGLRTFFAKRASKTLLPYVFWSLFGVAFRVWIAGNLPQEQVTVKFVLDGLLTGNCVPIYWFFIPLFCLYLSMPLFAAVAKDKRRRVFSYLAVAGFLLQIVTGFLTKRFAVDVPFSLRADVVTGYLWYVPVGYLLATEPLSKRLRAAIYALGFGGLAAHLAGTYWLSVKADKLVESYKGYLNVPCVLYAVAVFVLFRYGGEKLLRYRPVNRLVTLLSPHTFALYLLHWYVLTVLTKAFDWNNRSIVFRLLCPLAVTALVAVGSWVAKKIPVLRKLLP